MNFVTGTNFLFYILAVTCLPGLGAAFIPCLEHRHIFEYYFAASIEDCVKMDREYMTKINRYSQIHKCTVVYDTINKTGPDHDPE